MNVAQRPKTTVRKRPRQERARVTVDALLDATAQVLIKDGYDGLSTNRVAAVAGVSVGSLYQYFPSKEALVAALLDRYSDSTRMLVSEHHLNILIDKKNLVLVGRESELYRQCTTDRLRAVFATDRFVEIDHPGPDSLRKKK